MTENFGIAFSGLSGRAQQFIKENIDDGDGIFSTNEREALGQYLSGSKELSAEYSGVREELEEFSRYYDVAAARSQLYPEEADSVEIRCQMLGLNTNTIDCEDDYQTAKAIANGTIQTTPQQQAYAKALLARSPYAREKMAKEEGAKLLEQNQILLSENKSLKAQLAKYEGQARDTEALAEKALKSLPSINIPEITKKTCQNAAEKIASACISMISAITNTDAKPQEIIKNIKTAQNNIAAAKAEGKAALESANTDNPELAVESPSLNSSEMPGPTNDSTSTAPSNMQNEQTKTIDRENIDAGMAILQQLFNN